MTERISIGGSIGGGSGTEKIQLDELVDPFEAKLNVYRNNSGEVEQVAFNLSGLPRIDGMLVGKQALDVPDITKRLCGLCPVVHHLAGVRAVEALFGITEIPRPARLARELLCHGSTLDSLAMKFVATDRDAARLIKSAGQACLRAAGAKSHFPDVAVPGGVRSRADEDLVAQAADAIAGLIDSGVVAGGAGSGSTGAAAGAGSGVIGADGFDGLDIAVVDADGNLDPLGDFLGVAAPGRAELAVFPAAQWPQRVVETSPGAAAPRPTFDLAGSVLAGSAESTGSGSAAAAAADADAHFYRVGPIARLAVVGTRGVSPGAAQLALLRDTALRARDLLAEAELLGEDVCNPRAQEQIAAADFDGVRTGVGLVDGPRGLLVHRYTAGADGAIVDCQIMTPTAQNELWLTRMLTEVFAAGNNAIEESIWAADPCLPCSSAPAGLMSFKFEERGEAGAGTGVGAE